MPQTEFSCCSRVKVSPVSAWENISPRVESMKNLGAALKLDPGQLQREYLLARPTALQLARLVLCVKLLLTFAPYCSAGTASVTTGPKPWSTGRLENCRCFPRLLLVCICHVYVQHSLALFAVVRFSTYCAYSIRPQKWNLHSALCGLCRAA